MQVERQPGSEHYEDTSERENRAHDNQRSPYLFHTSIMREKWGRSPISLFRDGGKTLRVFPPSRNREIGLRPHFSINLQLAEEVRNFECRGVRPVRAVNGIPL